jgi:hypothetical protein
MPPLAPNLSQAATLRTISGWNNSSMSRRSNTMRGLLSTRTPQSSDTTSGGMLNPPLPPSIIAEAMPRGATGSFTPRVVLRRPSGGGVLPLSTWAGRRFADADSGETDTGPGTVAANSTPQAEGGQMLVFGDFVLAGVTTPDSGFNIGYIAGVLTAWQNLDPTETGFATVTNITSTTLTISGFGGGPTAFTLTAV